MNTGSPIIDEAFPRPVRWGEPELARLAETLRQPSLFYWKGPQTAALLAEFRKHHAFKHLTACSSGTAALHIAVAALRLRPGDEVIVPPITDMGSVIGILYQQAVPVFADVDRTTGNLTAETVAAALTGLALLARSGRLDALGFTPAELIARLDGRFRAGA